jgi:hypothetical protein
MGLKIVWEDGMKLTLFFKSGKVALVFAAVVLALIGFNPTRLFACKESA